MRDRPARLSLTRPHGRLARNGREIADPVVAALSHQREECALRVRALQDPPAAQDFDWSVDDSPAAGLHPPCCLVDVGDVEVIEPERDRLRCRLGEHTADRLPAGGEYLIRAYRTGVGFGLLPAEELAVEDKRLLPVDSDQLVPPRRPR